MSIILSKADMKQMISEMVSRDLDRAFDEEFSKAIERVKERRAEIVARAAVKIVKTYKIETGKDSLVITVEDRQN